MSAERIQANKYRSRQLFMTLLVYADQFKRTSLISITILFCVTATHIVQQENYSCLKYVIAKGI